MKFQNWQNSCKILEITTVATFGRQSTEKGGFWDAGNVLYLDVDGGFSCIYMSKNSGNCTLQIFAPYCMYTITSNKNVKQKSTNKINTKIRRVVI